MNNKAHRIRLKISGGIDHIQKFYEAVEKFAKFESFAHFKNFAITHNKTKQRLQTPLHDLWVELTQIEDRKS